MFPIAIFFNASHEDLGDFYGPPCTEKVVQLLQELDNSLYTRIMIGDLLLQSLAYDINTISKKESDTSSIKYKPNYDRYKTIVFDLADSLQNDFNLLNESVFLLNLYQNRIWTILLGSISENKATKINSALKTFPPYIGLAKIDTGNPIQMELFSSFKDESFIRKGDFYFRNDEMIDLEQNKGLARTYGASTKPILLDQEEFNKEAPSQIMATETTKRGKISLERYKVKSKPTHKQRVANSLLEYLESNLDLNEISFNVNLDKNAAEFLCEENKVKNYLLDKEHPDGGPKATFFQDELDIEREDWRYLSDQIKQSMEDSIIFKASKKHGIRHEAFSMVTGRNGISAVIHSVWEIKGEKGVRLITAYPGEKKYIDQFTPKPDNVVSPTLKGNEKWSTIYTRAHEAGLEAAKNFVPTPMEVEGFSTTFEGLCGFAWIIVPDARSGLARWLRKNDIGYPNSPSGQRVYPDIKQEDLNYGDIQSLEPKKAYANAFADVLKANAIECTVGSKLD